MYVKTPLSALELQTALAVRKGDSDFQASGMPSIEIVLASCKGLAMVDGPESTVRLMHYTPQEDLEGKGKTFIGPEMYLAENLRHILVIRRFPEWPLSRRRSMV